MGFYDGIKDAISLAQKADNIELYRQLLDLGAQALEMQNQIQELKNENRELKEKLIERQKIIRHSEGYLTIEDDEQEIQYCAVCYGNTGKMIQIPDLVKRCPICGNRFVRDSHSRGMVSQGISY